ncbi:MAG: methylmalonyl Co-A mutase-associated GTPase MeaB [Acidobacteria bacterium]|nr:methylmalonyl Co-A mutase-associated GTPase MeaB [Acidobacteriota bacterium]
MSEREQLLESWIESIRSGDVRAISRAITSVENGDAQAQELLRRLFPHTGHATLMGVTGAPGAGKSTLVDALATVLRKAGHTVGVLAVDPSSPFTGGAILGDRVRMQAHASDPGTYIRSMATRGALGGLSAATLDAAVVLDAAGKDFVLIETVGVGQDEIEIMRLADVTVLLLVPGMGDEVQAFKAGIMEIADIFVINKSDLPGAERLEQEIRALLSLAPAGQRWEPPVVKTVATEQQGVNELWEAISRYLAFSRDQGILKQRRVEHWQSRILDLLREKLLQQVLGSVVSNGALRQHAAAVASRQEDPYSVADEILAQAGHRAAK